MVAGGRITSVERKKGKDGEEVKSIQIEGKKLRPHKTRTQIEG